MEELIYAPGAVATLTVNRPKALNALNRPVLEGLMEALATIRGDSTVRVLIITGAGDRAFVAGADIAAMAEMGVSEGLEFTRLGHAVMSAIEDLPIPAIAAVNGFALGGGLELALACDLVIASDKARFGQPEINLGIIPGFGGTQRLPQRIGHARARELIMTGDMFDAQAAFTWGLASRIVAGDQLLDETRKLAEKIATKSGFTLRQAKAALRAAATMELDAGLRYEQNAFGVCFGSDDRVEGMQAFVAKRAAAWRHR